MSLKYNLMTIPLIMIYTTYSICYLVDLIKNRNVLNDFINKNKNIIILLAIIIVIVSTIRNLNNPLLY